LQAPAPVTAKALGYHDATTARILAEAGGTRLVWNPSLAGDLASYRVYRREDGAWKRIAQDLRDPVYFDAGVSARGYGVTAVDKSGNESALGTAK